MTTAQTSPSDPEPNSLISITLIGFWASTIYWSCSRSTARPRRIGSTGRSGTGTDLSRCRKGPGLALRSMRSLSLPPGWTSRRGRESVAVCLVPWPGSAMRQHWRLYPMMRAAASKRLTRRLLRQSLCIDGYGHSGLMRGPAAWNFQSTGSLPALRCFGEGRSNPTGSKNHRMCGRPLPGCRECPPKNGVHAHHAEIPAGTVAVPGICRDDFVYGTGRQIGRSRGIVSRIGRCATAESAPRKIAIHQA